MRGFAAQGMGNVIAIEISSLPLMVEVKALQKDVAQQRESSCATLRTRKRRGWGCGENRDSSSRIDLHWKAIYPSPDRTSVQNCSKFRIFLRRLVFAFRPFLIPAEHRLVIMTRSGSQVVVRNR